MTDLLWTCGNGTEFACESDGMRLVVSRDPAGPGYRYVISSRDRHDDIVSSGTEDNLRAALAAAERISRTLATNRPDTLVA